MGFEAQIGREQWRWQFQKGEVVSEKDDRKHVSIEKWETIITIHLQGELGRGDIWKFCSSSLTTPNKDRTGMK